MKPVNSSTVNEISSARAHTLAIIFLILAIMPFVVNFRAAVDWQRYLHSAQRVEQYGLPPQTSLQYYINEAIIPSVAMALPFVFFLGILLFKERRREYQFIKSKQEKIALGLSIITVLFFGLSYIWIGRIDCGFGCLILAPLIVLIGGIFPPLIFGFSLWFLKVRYQWEKRNFLAVTISLIFLLLLAYSQTPLFK